MLMFTRFLTISLLATTCVAMVAAKPTRPNILIAISDDQSFAHTSMAGYPGVSTPHFDRVAREGIYFVNGIAASPGCSPSRAAFLTGRHTWQIEEAGTHASGFPARYTTFMERLEQSGYHAGYTGKGWGPGNYELAGRSRNPAGPAYDDRKLTPPRDHMSSNDYAANFTDFLAARPADQPFVFWFGTKEPHRKYEQGSGVRAGKDLADTPPPSFLPDVPEIRSDMADYGLEIEWFDEHLGRILAQLEAAGELDNTLVIVTSDNGMAFPRAKANLYEYGIHVPLAIRWGDVVPAGRVVEDVVGFVDLSATVLDVAGVAAPTGPLEMAGRSLQGLLASEAEGLVDPEAVAFAARERHSSSRYQNRTYPQRALRTDQFLFIRNFRPDRWPAGDPVQLDDEGHPAGPHSGYTDIDACPTFDYLLAQRDDPAMTPYFELAVAKRPAEELYDIKADPDCLHNLAGQAEFASQQAELRDRLLSYLKETNDPRVIDGGEVWETYPRYSPMRQFPPSP